MKKLILFFLLIFSLQMSFGQSFGFKIQNEKDVVEIPFEVHNNFMVVKVIINRQLPLFFIFDTGAEHTILSKNILAAPLRLSYDRPIRIIGADLNKELVAYVSTKVHLQVGDAIAPQQDILILADDFFKIDEYVGMEIHGIIGADLFRNLVLGIDYNKNIITVQRSKNFKKPRRKWKEVPISIEKNKPYLLAKAHVNEKIIDVKLLMDTGASLSMLLHTNTNKDLQLPESIVRGSIGRGLGGILEGFLGRLKRLEFGEFYFNNIVTNYQDVADSTTLENISQRNGIFGNTLMRRFNVIIDYPRQKLYLKALRRYNKDFKYDKSGLELIVIGKKLKTVQVYSLIGDSPAKEAGFQKGDRILSVNYIPVNLIGLKGVINKLTKKSGKKIRIKLRRNGKTMVIKFKLRNLI